MGLGLYFIPRYRFFDTPDGEDYFKKLVCTARMAGITGLITTTTDVMLMSHPKTYGQVAARTIFHMGPLLGMAGIYTSVTYISANMRGGKDDYWNHLWGGLCAGTVMGPWRNSTAAGFYGALGLGLFGLIKKHCVMNGWIIFPLDKPIVEMSATGYKWDYSLVKDGTRRWTTDPNDTELDPRLSYTNILDKYTG